MQKCLKDLDMSYQKFFKKEHTGYPKFKSKRIDISLIEQVTQIIIFALKIRR